MVTVGSVGFPVVVKFNVQAVSFVSWTWLGDVDWIPDINSKGTNPN